jgi:hypothetical protein
VDAGQRGLGGFLVRARTGAPEPCPAPICLFVHSRPGHTRRTLDALAANSLAADSTLIVWSDGPRGPWEAARVEAVRALFHRETRFRQVELHEQEGNLGLARSVLAGLGEVFRRFDAAIILEDDIETSPHFLAFMNEGLTRYRNEPKVGAIHSYHFGPQAAPNGMFFCSLFNSWGWATWRRAWAGFEPDAGILLERLRASGQVHAFNLDGSYNFFRMLREQQLGYVDSWAIRWYASQFLLGSLALWPGRPLAANIGMDGSGTHSRPDAAYATVLRPVPGLELKTLEVRPDPAGRAQIVAFHRAKGGGPVLGWLRYHCPPFLKAKVERLSRRWRAR